MTYNEFLTSHLLVTHSERHKDMPYDVLFSESVATFESFEYSDYNKTNRGLYECLKEYIQNES